MYTQSGSPSRTGTLNRWQTSRYLLLSQDTFRRHCLLHPSLSCVVFSNFSAFNLLILILLLFSPPSLGCDLFVATRAYILAFFFWFRRFPDRKSLVLPEPSSFRHLCNDIQQSLLSVLIGESGDLSNIQLAWYLADGCL